MLKRRERHSLCLFCVGVGVNENKTKTKTACKPSTRLSSEQNAPAPAVVFRRRREGDLPVRQRLTRRSVILGSLKRTTLKFVRGTRALRMFSSTRRLFREFDVF